MKSLEKLSLKRSVLLGAFLFLPLAASGQRVWSSSKGTITFTKAGFADWTQAANQDRISDSVWITRASSQSLFNIRKESAYSPSSPTGTLWAFGTTDSFATLNYKTFVTLSSNNPQSLIGKNLVLKLVAENIYLDIKLLTYGSGGAGADFSYSRAATVTDVPSGSVSLPAAMQLGQNYPNPFNPTTTIEFTLSRDGPATLKVFDLLGHEVAMLATGTFRAGETQQVKVSAAGLASGVYFYRLESGATAVQKKFVLMK